MKKIKKIQLAASYFRLHLLQQWTLLTGLNGAKPSIILALLTWKCNFRCYFCPHPLFEERPMLSAEEWTRVLDKLRSWLGTCRVTFSGGEPLTRPDIFHILHHAQRLGMMIGMVTNGSLITKEFAKDLSGSNPFSISISLDSINPEVFATMRGPINGLERVLKGISHLLHYCSKDVKILIRTVVTKDNLPELLNIVKWAKELGITGVIFQPLDYAPIFDPEPPEGVKSLEVHDKWIQRYKEGLVKDIPMLNETFDALIAQKKAGAPIINSIRELQTIKCYLSETVQWDFRRRCQAGVQNLIIIPDGRVHTCVNTEFFGPIGDILTMSPKALYSGRRAREVRKEIYNCKHKCLHFSHSSRSLLEKAKLLLKNV